MNISTQSNIHRRFKCFVKFIAPEDDKRDAIARQADEIRDCIEAKAKEDGYTVIASRYSGSFSKASGLRRHLQGNDEVEGQDIDIGFILKDEDSNGNPLGCMIHKFEQYLRSNKAWEKSDIGHTKSSATISFKGSKNQFDAVPLIETGRKNIQKLIRTDGLERQSSVKQQTEFFQARTASSHKIDGVVRFNECVRLVKWWRYQRQSDSGVFGNGNNDPKVPSFLLDLLCAAAYDSESVCETYAETLARWFGFLAHTVRNCHEIIFSDFIKRHQSRAWARWKVIDPMDDTNNVVKNWPDYKIDELAEWFEKGRDEMMRAIRYDGDGDDVASLKSLVALFGNSIKNQCKDL